MSRWWILDDFFPDLLTGFRVAEYNALMRRFPDVRVATTVGHLDRAHAAYAERYPLLADRVVAFSPGALVDGRLAYLNFLNNAHAFLPHLTAHGLPFVLTLYPGGGFGLYEPASDAKLAEVLASPLLREVIVTQAVTADYVRERAPAGLPVTEIFGVVADAAYFGELPARPRFGSGKDLFDVAFVAEKYMRVGLNKGFPAFVQGVSRALGRLSDPAVLQVHVVGSYGEADWHEAASFDASASAAGAGGTAAGIAATPGGRAPVFHGTLETSRLRELLRTIDLVISPNLPGVLHPGNFDGFPTGCCVEAALSGAAFAATDPLGLSQGRFVHGQHYWHLEPGARAVERAVVELAGIPGRLEAIALAGQQVARATFSPEDQIDGRIAVLERHLPRPELARR